MKETVKADVWIERVLGQSSSPIEGEQLQSVSELVCSSSSCGLLRLLQQLLKQASLSFIESTIMRPQMRFLGVNLNLVYSIKSFMLFCSLKSVGFHGPMTAPISSTVYNPHNPDTRSSKMLIRRAEEV